MPRRPPRACGPVLRVLTANLLHGRAEPGALLTLARQSAADVLFVQELTGEAVARLHHGGIGGLFPHRVAAPAVRDTGIYARHPLHAGPAAPASCTARLELPSGVSVQLVCVHAPPPKAPWRLAGAAASWRTELARLPSPGDLPLAGLPVVMAGDFNATFDHAQFRRLLRRGYTDAAAQAGNGLAATWGPEPSGRPPLLTIDHVLTDPRCAVRTTSAHRLAGSDHRALFAEIRLPQ